jgi:hypothetical protein
MLLRNLQPQTPASTLALGLVMNAETKMAERLLKVIQPRPEQSLPIEPGTVPRQEEQTQFIASEASSEELDWLQVADLVGTFGHGIQELASPLSD